MSWLRSCNQRCSYSSIIFDIPIKLTWTSGIKMCPGSTVGIPTMFQGHGRFLIESRRTHSWQYTTHHYGSNSKSWIRSRHPDRFITQGWRVCHRIVWLVSLVYLRNHTWKSPYLYPSSAESHRKREGHHPFHRTSCFQQ
ncbi:hypothetical protein ABW21_db0209533 [Orbilia brochopaga]|nr:hypothetical protein ABW21_db0209533 [Drechslerella brochopaga]